MKNPIPKTLYNGFILPVTYGVFSAASLFHRKLRETFRGRRDVRRRWAEAAKTFDQRPVWFHVSSVGEFEQAKPVIATLSENYPDIPVAVSITSPSGYKYALAKETVGNGSNIRFLDYLPIDFAANSRFCLTAMNPRLLVFVKFDLWPNLVWEAAEFGIPSVLIDATLSETSYRFKRLGRRFYRSIYDNLDEILAISEKDAARFSRCVPDHNGISVTGDTRFDRVMQRNRTTNGLFKEIGSNGRFVIIAGSTWPKDEAHLLGALDKLAASRGDLLYIIAPHEPTEERVDELLKWAMSCGLEAASLSERDTLPAPNGKAQVLVIDSVGILAEAYQAADVAYVGGSFSTGVHSVIEPAIMGIPVMFGPVHENSFEAIELLERRAAVEVNDEAEIYDTFQTLAENKQRRDEMGSRARSFVESQLGATKRCMEKIRKYL